MHLLTTADPELLIIENKHAKFSNITHLVHTHSLEVVALIRQ